VHKSAVFVKATAQRGNGNAEGDGMLRTTGGLSGELLQFAFAIGPKRIAPLWRLLAGIAVDARRHAIEMAGARSRWRSTARTGNPSIPGC